jgi:type II secretory pathway component GspD/PulD (secretin)
VFSSGDIQRAASSAALPENPHMADSLPPIMPRPLTVFFALALCGCASSMPPPATAPALGVPDAHGRVTHVIPLTTLRASRLVNDLRPLVSEGTLAANDDANCLILVGTADELRRMTGIVQALEERPVTLRRTTLEYLRAEDAAVLVEQLFDSPRGAD